MVSHQLQAALPQLSTFLAVAHHRSFSGAARELGISTSAVSQAVRQLEELLRVALLHRTTRSVTPTEAGARLIENTSGPLKLALEALLSADAAPGEVVGRVKLCLPEPALRLLEPIVPVLCGRYPRISLEVIVKEPSSDFVAEGFDAAFAASEFIARDMVRVRLTAPFKYVVAASPAYFAKHEKPRKPEDLLEHDCINMRWPGHDSLYVWEFERGRRKWRVPVRGSIVTNNPQFYQSMAEQGMGLLYGGDLRLKDSFAKGRLVPVLEDYARVEAGVFLCFQKHAQQSAALRQFVNVAKEVARRR
jgi:DNA-binding transcriptional LysR family regulator